MIDFLFNDFLYHLNKFFAHEVHGLLLIHWLLQINELNSLTHVFYSDLKGRQ